MDTWMWGAIIGGSIGLLISIPLVVRQARINKGSAVANIGKRFARFVPFTGDFEAMTTKIIDTLTANKYFKQAYGQEEVYRKGSGMLTASRMFKFLATPEGYVIEAFVILSGTKEVNLEGIIGVGAKKPLKKLALSIVQMIEAENNK